MNEGNREWITVLIGAAFLAFGIVCVAWPQLLRNATVWMYRRAPGCRWSQPLIQHAESSSSDIVVRLVGFVALVAAVLLAVLFLFRA